MCTGTPARLGGYPDRCGYGPRLPLLVISPVHPGQLRQPQRDRPVLGGQVHRGQLAATASGSAPGPSTRSRAAWTPRAACWTSAPGRISSRSSSTRPPVRWSAPSQSLASDMSMAALTRATRSHDPCLGQVVHTARAQVPRYHSAVQSASRYHSTSVHTSGRGVPPVSTEAKPRAASLRWARAASRWPAACSRSARLVCSAATRCWSPSSRPSASASWASGSASAGRPLLGQQPGQVVQRGHRRPRVGQPARLVQALPQPAAAAVAAPAPGGQHAQHVQRLGDGGRVRRPGAPRSSACSASPAASSAAPRR